MAIGMKRRDEEGTKPVFLSILEDIPGGVTIDTSQLPSPRPKLLQLGQLLSGEGGIWNVVKSARLALDKSANATAIVVDAGHLFKVGDFVKLDGQGTGITISGIIDNGVTSHISLASNRLRNAENAGEIIDEASSAVHTGAVVKYIANGMLRATVRTRDNFSGDLDNITGAVVIRGSVREDLVPSGVSGVQKRNLTDRLRFA